MVMIIFTITASGMVQLCKDTFHNPIIPTIAIK